MKYSTWILIAFFALGCNQNVEQQAKASQPQTLTAAAEAEASAGVIDIPVDQAQDMIKTQSGKPDFIIVDVRTPREYAAGHLPGAQLMNLFDPDFQQKLQQLDRDKTYLVYCRSGNRSGQAISIMEKLGFKNVYHMYQGFMTWEAKGLPVEK
ncbi:MAG: rhodanese-like domain-containing protein [candidate division KSB1 bacterium]|nr:rhodanese-like domain-containing protein [candidate division KSB1 bacterium]MDQ7062882.1 rhodanese-like domain-containing protein [candidate division KSB1 bacterium]